MVNIKGYELTYKDPPFKGNIFRYRWRQVGCNYFVKIALNNVEKINRNEKENIYTEINTHTHKNEPIVSVNIDSIKIEKEVEDLAKKLILKNLNEPLEFSLNNFANNKILWKNSNIRKLFYAIREEAYPKDNVFLYNINQIKITL